MSTSISELPNELNIENNKDNISMVVQEKNKIVPSMNIREDVSVDPLPNTLEKESMKNLLNGF